MATIEEVKGWLTGRLPKEWFSGAPEIRMDEDEIWVIGTLPDVQAAHLDRPWWDGGLLNPIGDFIPNKVFALVVIMLCGLVAITSYLRAYSRGEVRMGETTRRLQGVLLALGVTVSLMMATMGVIRENSRQPFLIHGELRLQHQQIVTTPPQAPP